MLLHNFLQQDRLEYIMTCNKFFLSYILDTSSIKQLTIKIFFESDASATAGYIAMIEFFRDL